jgi:hypothetical protein
MQRQQELHRSPARYPMTRCSVCSSAAPCDCWGRCTPGSCPVCVQMTPYQKRQAELERRRELLREA